MSAVALEEHLQEQQGSQEGDGEVLDPVRQLSMVKTSAILAAADASC